MSTGKVFKMAAAAIGASAMIVSTTSAAAADPVKDYPSKPVRFIAPFTPGAGTDTTARTIAQKLSDKWGQQVVVDNRTGAAGATGVDITAKAPPDGYTICLISASHSVNSATNTKLPYDLTKDLQGITQATSLFYVVYHHPSVPVKSIRELIAYAKANPGKLNFGSSGTGGLQHFAGEMFNHMAGIKITHVPFKGSASVIVSMLSGEVQVGFGTLFGVRPHMQSGRLHVLAITAAKRSPAAPELPTVAESGYPGYEVTNWHGLVAPKGLPRDIVERLNREIGEVVKGDEMKKNLAADGLEPAGGTPARFGEILKSEMARWAKVVQQAGIKID